MNMAQHKANLVLGSTQERKDRPMLRGAFMALGIAETLVIAMIVLAAFLGTSGHAAELDSRADFVLAYANIEEQNFEDPFGDVFMDDHELNDAWMGMEVRTIDGDIAGFISDAILNADGTIETVFVSPGGEGELRTEMAIGADFVILGDYYVTVDMTLNTLSAQSTSAQYLETTQVK